MIQQLSRNADTWLVQTLSPELALVDEELAEAARRRLRPPSSVDSLASESRQEDFRRRAEPAVELPPHRAEVHRRRLPRRLLATAALVSAVTFVPASAVTEWGQTEPRPGSSPEARSSQPLASPSGTSKSGGATRERAGESRSAKVGATSRETTQPTVNEPSSSGARARSSSTASTARLIRWRAAPEADVYNVIFLDGDRRVDFWPHENRLALGSPDSPMQLEPGSYTWYVYPGYREEEEIRYGPLLANGTLVVTG